MKPISSREYEKEKSLFLEKRSPKEKPEEEIILLYQRMISLGRID